MTVRVLYLFLMVPLFGLQCVIMAFPGHTHLLLFLVVTFVCNYMDRGLIYSSRIKFSIIIKLSSPFPILGVLGGIFSKF